MVLVLDLLLVVHIAVLFLLERGDDFEEILVFVVETEIFNSLFFVVFGYCLGFACNLCDFGV